MGLLLCDKPRADRGSGRAAVHDDLSAGYIGSLVRCQVQRGLRYLLGFTHTTESSHSGSVAKLAKPSGRVEYHADHPEKSLQIAQFPMRCVTPMRSLLSTISL